MISHGKEIKVFTGNSNPVLAEEICAHLNKTLGDATVTQFADGECSISVHEPVRGCDVFIVQSTCKSVNDNLMEMLIMIDAMRRASAGRITAVIPYFGYARQDRKAKSRDPISAKLVANLITAAGADRVLTMDLHAAQIQGFFDIPVDNLMGAPLFAKHYMREFGKGNEDVMVVSPDVGWSYNPGAAAWQPEGLIASLFRALGDLSYPLYVLHLPVIYAVAKSLQVFPHAPVIEPLVWTASLSGLVLVAWWIARRVDLPAQALLRPLLAGRLSS